MGLGRGSRVARGRVQRFFELFFDELFRDEDFFELDFFDPEDFREAEDFFEPDVRFFDELFFDELFFDDVFVLPSAARSLFTVRAAISFARFVDRPCFFALSLMCSY